MTSDLIEKLLTKTVIILKFLSESVTNFRITCKYRDQISGLLINITK